MKKYWFIVLLFIISTISFGQDKLLTIEDAVIGVNSHMYPERISQLKWQGNIPIYTFVKDTNILQSSLNSKKDKVLINLEEINTILKTAGLEELNYIPGFSWMDNNNIRFYHNNHAIVLNISTKTISYKIALHESAAEYHFSNKAKSVAYTVDNNLYYSTTTKNAIQITNDKNKGIVNGTGYVHRSEFGIVDGIFWSANGNYIAFYRKDETMVDNYPQVDIKKRIAELRNDKYPMAGMKSEEVQLGIYDLKNNSTIFIKTGEPKEQYLTSITWDPNEKYIYIALLNRGQNHLKLNKYDIKTGELVKTLFEEKHEKYVEPENSLIFFKNKSTEFLWFSERDGYNHIYRYNTEGKLINQITKGEWVVTELHGLDPKEQYIYFTSTKESPIERHVYRAKISDGSITKLTPEEGTHTPTFDKSFKYFIDNYSSIEVPRDYYIRDYKGKIIKTILKAENPLKDFKTGEMNIFTIKGGDDTTDIYCRMIKPVDFDPDKKYPAVIYVYGGPHSQLVQNTWMGNSWVWQYYMAQKGYVMLTIDNRGTNNRGLNFENIIHRQLGIKEIEDQIKGVDYLINTGFVDSTRIGLHGWSYGGFMTLSMIEKYPDKFKVGVAGGPVTDWKYYEIMYGERYMDTPEENPEGYENASVLNKAKKLDGKKIFVVNGGIDNVVIWQNSLELIQKCIEEGVLLDYFVYPRHKHNVRGKDRVHLMRKVTQYFDDFL